MFINHIPICLYIHINKLIIYKIKLLILYYFINIYAYKNKYVYNC